MAIQFFTLKKNLVLGSILSIAISVPAFAGTVTLVGGSGRSCTYSSYVSDSNNNIVVTCDSVTRAPATPSPPVVVATPSPSVPNTGSIPVPQPNQPMPATIKPVCKIVEVDWAGGFKYNTTPWQHLPPGTIFAFKMTVPAGKRISMSGTAYADVPEVLSISTNPCDFSAKLTKDNCMTSGDNDPILYNGPGTVSGAYCNTPVGATIYYNIKHSTLPDGSESCPAGKSCKFSFYW